MRDTSPDIADKQFEIMMNKSPRQRFLMGIEMIENGIEIVEKSIKNSHPEYSAQEFKFAFIKRMYGHEYSDNQLAEIKQLIEKGS